MSVQRVMFTRDQRKEQALDAGLALAQKSGVKSVSVSSIARECDVTAPLLFHIFGNRDKLHEAIKRHARKRKVKLPTDAATKKRPAAPASAPRPARKRSVAEVKAIKDKAAGKRPAVKKAAKKRPVAKKAGTAAKKSKRAAPAAGRTAGASPAGSRKRFKTQPAPAVAVDVATPGDAPAA